MAGLALGISLIPVFYPTLTHIYNKKASLSFGICSTEVPLTTLGVSLLPILQKVSKNDKMWFYSKVNAKEMANGTAM